MLLNSLGDVLCAGDKLWWAVQGTDQIGTCDKSDGKNWKVLRNKTSSMMHMKIYNETVHRLGTLFTFVHFRFICVYRVFLRTLGLLVKCFWSVNILHLEISFKSEWLCTFSSNFIAVYFYFAVFASTVFY